MKTRTSIRARPTVTFLLLCSIPILAAEGPATGNGDQWEVTSKMSMEGMPMEMGAQTHRVCAPKEWEEPPGGANGPGQCEASDFQKTATKVTWKVSCSGPPAMSGVGEIVRDGDSAYAGTIRFTTEGAVMIMKINGRRLGSCNVAQ